MATQFLFANGPMPTTAAFAPVATTAVIKTLLQLKPFNTGKIIEWGISFDGFAAAAPVKVELLDTGTVFATVTAAVDADVFKLSGGEDAVASVVGLTLGATATGYTASAEGSIVATRLFDVQLVAPTNQYLKQFPLGREPKVLIGNAVRVRVTAPQTVNAIAYVVVEF